MVCRYATIFILFFILVMSCGKQDDEQSEHSLKTNLPKILVISKCTSQSIWVTVKTGADSAAKKLGATIIWREPENEADIAGQIKIVEECVRNGIHAIVLAVKNKDSLTQAIKKSVPGKLPIISIDSRLDDEWVMSQITTNNFAAAEQAADLLAKLIGKKGKVALIPFFPRALPSMMREQGFLKGIKKYKDIEVVAIHYSHREVAIGMAVAEDILTAHPDIDGFFAADEASTIGVVQALKNRNKVNQVKVVGFDGEKNEILALQKGFVDALIVQDPLSMGYLGIKTALDAIKGKSVKNTIETEVYVVTRKNLETPEIKRVLGI